MSTADRTRMMKNLITAQAFSPKMIRTSRTWGWVRSDFSEEFSRLSDAGALQPGGISETIWSTRSKYVLKVATSLGFDIAYKSFFKITGKTKYLFRSSPCAAEAANYIRLAELGFPLPDLLAVGEMRCCGILKNAFMVSRFIDDYRTGLDFFRDGIHVGDEPLFLEFCRGNLKLLARLHDLGIVHRGFTPGNLLYRNDPDGMKFCWIDVASCRRSAISTPQIATDMFHLFRYLKTTPENRRALEAWYLDAVKIRRTNLDELFETVEKRIENRMKE